MAPQTVAKIGWDELERQEFSKALKQSLLVQTPLQVILETLFNRIQSQAAMFGDLQKRIERIEARDINGEELLGRIRVCEDALSAINHEKLSPFHQQEVLQRIEDLEIRVSAGAVAHEMDPSAPTPAVRESISRRPSMHSLADANKSTTATASPQAEPRIEALEKKLAGVYNLGGKLAAVEQIAVELGIDIPDTEYEPKLDGDAAGSFSAPEGMADRAVSFQTPHAAANASARGMAIAKRMAGKEGESDVWPGKGDMSSGGAPTLSRNSTGLRMAEVLGQVDELRTANESLQELIGDLKGNLQGLSSKVTQGEEALSLRVAVLEAAGVEMRENIMGEIAVVRKEVNREPEVSYADFSALSSQLEAAVTEVSTAASGLTELKDQQVTPLKTELAELKEQFKRAHETRDMDTLFHNRISKLEGTVGDIKSEVALAVQDVLEDVAKLADLAALEDAIEKCATASDVRQLASQQAALAQSLSGMADWLAVRPDTADGIKGTGSSATRFKCLTCDREIRTQNGGTPPGDSKARGTFLPKLEGLPGSHPGAPIGPGINAGELRRLAEEKAGGRKGSPLRGTEVEDYGTAGKVSPGKTQGSGRIAISMPMSSIMPKPQAGAQRTPVFI